MPREETQEKILAKLQQIQKDNEEPVWVSGKQVTELLPKLNPSSVRMALLLLHDRGLVIRERRKGRGPKGKTGQSAWYSLTGDWVVLEEGIKDLRKQLEDRQVDTRTKESV